jgi:hypothetical protein
MAHQLSFNLRYEYNSLADGITIETALYFGERSITVQAKVDPGGQLCLFQREVADELKIDVESGHPTRVGTLMGSLPAYGHTVTLSTLGIEFESFVYFAADYRLPRNLLGREGWLQKVRLAIVDYDATLYLSPYDEVNAR